MGLSGWIGVDLDGTLAHYAGWQGPDHIGAPIPAMVEKVKAKLAEGTTVKVFTARVAYDTDGSQKALIQDWTEKYIGQRLDVTNEKDYATAEIWDDRAKQVIFNKGEFVE